MALGISYEKMAAKLPADFLTIIQTQGTFGFRVDQLYVYAGLENERDYKTLYRSSNPESSNYTDARWMREFLVGSRAILQVPSLNYENSSHIVYWDGIELFDPSVLSKYTWDRVEPSYIRLFKDK